MRSTTAAGTRLMLHPSRALWTIVACSFDIGGSAEGALVPGSDGRCG